MPYGKLHATPNHAFVGDAGPRSLIGPNLQPVWSPRDPGTWPQRVYDSISAKGFTAVRFVLFWDDFEPQQGDWNETAFTTLTIALGRARSAGLYVLLDCVHLYGGPDGQSRVPRWARRADGMDAVATNGLGFLRQIASRYGDDDAVAAYDPVNEPARSPLNHRTVLADYTRIVDAIRAEDPVTSIIIEPTYGDASVPVADFSAFRPASRAHLIWSIHDYYVGGAGTGYEPDGASPSPGAADGTTGYDPANRADLAARLQVQLDLAAKVGMPLWIGEFGIGQNAPGHDEFIRDKIALYRAEGVGFAWWEYYESGDGPFSMIDETDAWYQWVDLLL
jgi:hypothetical protein